MENNSENQERRVVIELDNVKRDFIVGSETVHALRDFILESNNDVGRNVLVYIFAYTMTCSYSF